MEFIIIPAYANYPSLTTEAQSCRASQKAARSSLSLLSLMAQRKRSWRLCWSLQPSRPGELKVGAVFLSFFAHLTSFCDATFKGKWNQTLPQRRESTDESELWPEFHVRRSAELELWLLHPLVLQKFPRHPLLPTEGHHSALAPRDNSSPAAAVGGKKKENKHRD